MNSYDFMTQTRGQLIVSCQALPGEPLYGAQIMARMALAAQMGGAAAIRANGPDDIQAIKESVLLPVIGLFKDGDEGVYITPSSHHARQVIEAGADVVAFDATNRPRSGGETTRDLVETIHAHHKLALADVSTFEEAQAAQEAGVDFAASTLAGYTPYSSQLEGPDYALIRMMAQRLQIPVIAEGRIRTPEEARLALQCGALTVVVGSAITRPQLITRTFSAALK